MVEDYVVPVGIRYPKGAECQCDKCGVFFTSESAFRKHWTRDGHADPAAVGLVERQRARGPVWGWPGDESQRFGETTGTATDGEAGLSEPGEAGGFTATAPGAALGLVGSRGPSGGMVARCSWCGRLWERPKQRGRPPSNCGECR